jgi:hypothetical protein
LGRPIDALALAVPDRLEIQGDRLTWSALGKARQRPVDAAMGADVLDRFVRLGDRNDVAIGAFGREFGPLGICRHDLPLAHETKPYGSSADDIGCSFKVSFGMASEPISAWRRFADEVGGLLDVAVALHRSQPVRNADWDAIRKGFAWTAERQRKSDDPRKTVAKLVNGLLALGDVRPGMEWTGADPQLYFRSGLFGLLATQLLAAVSRAEALIFCMECGHAYGPKRLPHPNERHFCRDCREKRAAAKLRARKDVGT